MTTSRRGSSGTKGIHAVFSLLVFSTLILCAVEKGEARFLATPAEARVPERFRLEDATFPFEMETRLETDAYTVKAVRFPSPIRTTDVENNTVHAEYFVPKGIGSTKRPAVIVLHILGADFALSRYMAVRFADRGIAALFVKLPYYGERRPIDANTGEAKKFLSPDIERSVLAMRQGICDVRRAVAWLASRPEVDAEKVGITGISLGGIVSSIAAAVDPNLNRAALLLAGGDLASVLWNMPEGARYKTSWIKSGRTFQDLETLTLPFDPLTYASGLKGKRVIMMAGNTDDVIPPESARKLWEAAGRPPITWFDCGHYSAVGYLLPAIRQTVDFFASDLER